jgi:tripeptide aminopeptidase
MNRQRLLERFLRYVSIDTTAREDAVDYPSSAGQLELGRMLVEELHALGAADAQQDQHGIVLATLASTMRKPGGVAPPTIAFCAHLDTSPEMPGAGIKPRVIENYAGDELGSESEQYRGRTIIVTDGTTLLGADDKAGVAAIMETAAFLMENPQVEHGPLRICFTCDEEIGRGVDKLDPRTIGAVACYTLDGEGADRIDVETFSADLAVVTVHGRNIHPSIAKGRMVNAVRAAAALVDRLPRDRLSPESTEGRDGFLHPYEIQGGVSEVKMRILLRDFQAEKLGDHEQLLRQAADAVASEFPGVKIDVEIHRQYRNMAEGLSKEPRAVARAKCALERLGRTAQLTIVRGGTDGSRLTELGLPTPNLSCGAHNPHAASEWACLEEMEQAAEWIVALAEEWGKEG